MYYLTAYLYKECKGKRKSEDYLKDNLTEPKKKAIVKIVDREEVFDPPTSEQLRLFSEKYPDCEIDISRKLLEEEDFDYRNELD